MSDDNFFNKEQTVVRGRSWIAFLVLAIVFIGACLLKPDLVWAFFLAFMASMIAIIYFSDTDSMGVNNKLGGKNFVTRKDKGIKYYKSISEALQFPAYVLNANGTIIYSNAAAINAFGSSMPGEKIYIRFRQPEIRRLIEKAIASENPVTGEYHVPIPDDRWFAVEVAAIPHLGKERDVPLFLLGFHDLTEAKRTDQMRSDFIANASHELRTPLASLQGYIETIKGPARNDDKAIDRFSDIMLDQAQRMTRLVNDLLSLSRIEMQSHVRPSEVVDLTEIVASVVDALANMAETSNVKIEFDHIDPVKIIGDRDGLLQVFQNLIENACKYGEEGERVIVKIDHDIVSSHVMVSVRDFGPGIAIEDQQRITERFYRVDVARSRAKQGTGLGLAIVKHILNRHMTKLGIESKPNEGACFYIRFPVVE